MLKYASSNCRKLWSLNIIGLVCLSLGWHGAGGLNGYFRSTFISRTMYFFIPIPSLHEKSQKFDVQLTIVICRKRWRGRCRLGFVDRKESAAYPAIGKLAICAAGQHRIQFDKAKNEKLRADRGIDWLCGVGFARFLNG